MTENEAAALVIRIAANGSQTAAAAELGCSPPTVVRQFKAARALLGDERTLDLITQHQKDEASGVTLRKPFITGTGICGVCGGEKTRNPSGKLRCNACRNKRYRGSHPQPDEPSLTPEETAVSFVVRLAKEGTQRLTSVALGVSQAVVSERLKKAREVLGDERVIELLVANMRDESCRTNLLKPFIINKPVCGACGSIKTAATPGGPLVCRACANARNAEYKTRYPDRVQAGAADYYVRNKETIRPKKIAYYKANREAILASIDRVAKKAKDAAYYETNAERIKAQVRAYARANRERISAYTAKRRETDPSFREALRIRHRAWKKRNPHKVNADTARRQLRLRQAYVAWADDERIEAAYELARLRTKSTGTPWEVDHIVPLTSDLVCGLHCADNLQVIPASANLAKKNFWWPQMPGDTVRYTFVEQPSQYL